MNNLLPTQVSLSSAGTHRRDTDEPMTKALEIVYKYWSGKRAESFNTLIVVQASEIETMFMLTAPVTRSFSHRTGSEVLKTVLR